MRVGKVTLSTAAKTRAEEYHSDLRSECTYVGTFRGGSKTGIYADVCGDISLTDFAKLTLAMTCFC